MSTKQAIPVVEYQREAPSADLRVDRDAGIIYGVKVLGLVSRNTGRTIGLTREEFGEAIDKPYRYAPEALAEAVPLYEDARVFVDHPGFIHTPDGERQVIPRERESDELFGKLKNVQAGTDGLRADLHFLRDHPLAGRVCEAAERMPDLFSLSHNAAVEPQLIGGEIVIVKIIEVRSVDLVGVNPGTTSGLFESKSPTPREPRAVKKTIKQILESVPNRTPGVRVLEAMFDEERLAEEESPLKDEVEQLEETEVELPSETTSPEEQVSLAFDAAVIAILQSDISIEEKKAKIAALLDLKEDVATGGTATETEGEKETTESEEEESKPSATESAHGKPIDKSAVVLESIKLLNQAGVPVTESYVEAMAGLPSTEKRKAFANDLKKAAAPEITPRSGEGRPAFESAGQQAKQKTPTIDYGKNPGLGAKALRGIA